MNFEFEAFQQLLKTALEGKTLRPVNVDDVFEREYEEADFVGPVYTDFFNIFCLLNGIRHGAHIEAHTLGGYMVNGESYMDYEVVCGRNDYLGPLLSTLTGLSVSRFPWLKFNRKNEVTLWNADVLGARVLNSWAFHGGAGLPEEDAYWENNRLLFGNALGYPTYTTDQAKRGAWSLDLHFKMDGAVLDSVSMCGGVYDRSRRNQDFASILHIQNFLRRFVGRSLYNPDGHTVSLVAVTLSIDGQNVGNRGGALRRSRKNERRSPRKSRRIRHV